MAYPLEALRKLRADEEEAAAQGLARAVEALSRASEAVRQAEEAHHSHLTATERELERELARPLSSATVSGAPALAAWRTRRRHEAQELAGRITKERERERACERDLEAAREHLANARREREALEKHHDRWLAEERKRAEARAEAEIDDRVRR